MYCSIHAASANIYVNIIRITFVIYYISAIFKSFGAKLPEDGVNDAETSRGNIVLYRM
jgi:ABC-type glucose/galactose transport system permease subunit